MRGRTAIIVLLLAGTSAAALASDAGSPPPDAGVPPDAAAVAPVDPLARRQTANAVLRQKIQAIDAEIARVEGWGERQLAPPDAGELVFSDPAEAIAKIRELAGEHQRLLDLAADEAAKEKALAPLWAPQKKRRKKRPDAALLEARLEGIRLERALLERRAALALARRRYLERTQPARLEAKARQDASAREHEEQRRKAKQEEEEAREEQRKAHEESQRARNTPAGILGAEKSRLYRLKEEQARFKSWLLNRSGNLRKLRAELLEFRRKVQEQMEVLRGRDDAEGDHDDLYSQVLEELDLVRAMALASLTELFRGLRKPPEIPTRLSDAVRKLGSEYREGVRGLRNLRAELRDKWRAQTVTNERIAHERLGLLREEAGQLNDLRIALLSRISSEKRAARRGFTEETVEELRGEAMQVGIEVGFWLHERWHLALHVIHGRHLVELGSILWRIFVIAVLLLVMRFALRRWDPWMTASVEAVGSAMPLGGWTLFFARSAEILRACGPALVVVLTSLGIYHYAGGAEGPAEAQIAFILVFWAALFRFQLRFFEALVQYLSSRARDRAQRQREQREEEAANAAALPAVESSTVTEQGKTAERAKTSEAQDSNTAAPTEVEPFSSLFSRTWRVATRYVAVVVILLELTEYAVGAGVFHGLVTRFGWWLFLPFAIYFLRLWRPRVVNEYLRRAPQKGSLAQITERHSGRFYGIFVVAVALFVVLGMSVASFVKENLSNLDSTKRVLAFLFRRRVEKHAHEHGRVLDRPPELPPDLLAQFPTGPIDPESDPVEPAALPRIAAQFATWKESGHAGSVALVGASGMGKSTTLRMLESRLGEPVCHAKLISKVTRIDQLTMRLARLLELEGEPRTERELIAMLQDFEYRVVAIDNCHNLFLRHVGGFDAWEAFVRLVSETSDNIFWVLSFNDAAWEYLDNINGRAQYFHTTIHMEPWTDEQLRRLILSRTRRARYRVNFTDLLVTRLEGVKMSTQIIGTSQGYFRLLWDFTDGNPRLASHFWLRSLVPDSNKRRVRVHLFAAPKNEELDALSDDILFVMVAVVEHENITAAELAPITGFTPEFCRTALRVCRDRGYMWRNPSTGRTHLSFHWQQTIQRYLKRKHLLYS